MTSYRNWWQLAAMMDSSRLPQLVDRKLSTCRRSKEGTTAFQNTSGIRSTLDRSIL